MNIQQSVKQYLADNILMDGKAGDLPEDASFLRRGILDSTGVIELVGFLEQTYDIQVADEEIVPENLDSLRAIETFVSGKLAGRRPQPATGTAA